MLPFLLRGPEFFKAPPIIIHKQSIRIAGQAVSPLQCMHSIGPVLRIVRLGCLAVASYSSRGRWRPALADFKSVAKRGRSSAKTTISHASHRPRPSANDKRPVQPRRRHKAHPRDPKGPPKIHPPQNHAVYINHLSLSYVRL